MGVRIMIDSKRRVGALYCDTSDWAFGPVFNGGDPREEIESFLGYARKQDINDVRVLNDFELRELHSRWAKECLDEDGCVRYRSVPGGTVFNWDTNDEGTEIEEVNTNA